MVSWPTTLSIEEKRIRCIYKLLNGFMDADIRDLHIPGDIRTNMKTTLEIKGWNRNSYIPLETWSVIENKIFGWALTSQKLRVWFVKTEREEAVGIDLPSITRFLNDNRTGHDQELLCQKKGDACHKAFTLPEYSHEFILYQNIQSTDSHRYHSACLYVKPDAFAHPTYVGRMKTPVIVGRLL